jgi:hypothetical protein
LFEFKAPASLFEAPTSLSLLFKAPNMPLAPVKRIKRLFSTWKMSKRLNSAS